jgi:hypothetical protein
MMKSEINEMVEWDDYNCGYLRLFVPLFSKELPFVLFWNLPTTPVVSDKMVAIINEVLALQPENLDRVRELLWEECNFAFQVADYGVDAEADETPLQAHLREFGISSPNDAYDRSDIQSIQISDEFGGRYAEIKVDTGSSNLISIIVKNGQIIDFDDDGTYLGWFDEDELYAHKNRQKVLID